MSSTHGHAIDGEVYPTPRSFIRSLLDHVKVRPGDNFLEPCRGPTRVIYDMVPLPESQKYWAELSEGRDYLATPFAPGSMDLIITNPPFSLTTEFMEKSLQELKPDGTMIYMQRVNFLGSLKREEFWQRIGFPNKFPVILPRPKFVGKDGDSTEYAWFVWDRGNRLQLPVGISSINNPYVEEERRELAQARRELKRLAKAANSL